jgi:hypothetical protein
MWNKFCLILALLCWMPLASAGETVIRGAQAIRDGNLYADAVYVDFGDEASPSKVIDMVRAMPRLEMLVIGGPRFEDRHLTYLGKRETLHTLVLDSVDVSDKAILALQRSRPELVVIRSQRLAIEAIQRLHTEIEIKTELSEMHPEIRKLLGDRYFREATVVDFGRLPDDESGPFDRFLNEELAPLRMLPTLIRLDLSWTRLNDGGMYYLRPLTRLEQLSIPLDEVSADGLIHLREIVNLKSFGGRIDDAGMRQLTGLQALEVLKISQDSEMTDAGLESIGRLKRLKTLTLLAPQIEGAGLRHIAPLPDLQDLVLGAGVRDLTAMPEFKSLRELNLSGTAVNDEALTPLAECHRLEILSLDQTAIGDKGIKELSRLTCLRSISLRDTQVGDAGLMSLQPLPKLRNLSIDRTRVSNGGLAALQKFAALEYLTLYGMPLDEEGIGNLMELKQLKSLSVSYPHTDASTSAAHRELHDRLRKALPNCKIY